MTESSRTSGAAEAIAPGAILRIDIGRDRSPADLLAGLPAVAAAGITHLRIAPVLETAPGGDPGAVADHSAVSAALGGEEGLRRLATEADAHGLRLLAALSPGHMAAGPTAPRWEALLSEGRSGDAARMFDVDWESPLPGSIGKVILPVLAEPYGDALAAGLIGLRDPEGPDGGVRITYRDMSFPVAVASIPALERAGTGEIPGVPGEERTWGRMHSLLEQQHYRLVSVGAGTRLVNYRRALADGRRPAVRLEDATVLASTHALVIRLVEEGVLAGIVVSDLEGLADPRGYLRWLRSAVPAGAWCAAEVPGSPAGPDPAVWDVDATTDGAIVRLALGLQIDPAGLRTLTDLAARQDALPDEEARVRLKAELLYGELGPDLRRATREMWAACQDEPRVRDVDYRTLLEAVSRIATALPVPRTLVDPADGAAGAQDRAAVAAAVASARAGAPGAEVPDRLWVHLERLLSGDVRWTAAAALAVTRFQQLTGPALSLGLERLSMRHNALVAASEVGVDPDDATRTLTRAHAELAALHDRGLRTATSAGSRMGEDLRIRIVALSGMAADFADVADRLLSTSAVPDRALGLRLLQIAIGLWPREDDGDADLQQVLATGAADRLAAHAVHAARIQGVLTSRRHPVAAAEDAIAAWARGLLDPSGDAARALRPLALRTAETGMAASLSQVLVRLLAPGIPEVAAGAGGWDDRLAGDGGLPPGTAGDGPLLPAGGVSPEGAGALWAARRDGRVKTHVHGAALAVRCSLPGGVLRGGDCTPVPVAGRWADHTFAFARSAAGAPPAVVVVSPRALGRVTDGGRFPPLGRIWADTEVSLPGETPWVDALTGHTVPGGTVALAALLDTLPVALLVASDHI